MQPYYADESATLYRGDALAVLRELPDASVDAVVTDPPYSSGGQFRADRLMDVRSKYITSDKDRRDYLTEFSGDTRDGFGYWFWCSVWLSECMRVVKPGGAMVMFTDWRQLPSTIGGIQSGGWVWRGVVPWHKPGARPIRGRFSNSCEYVVWGTNGGRPLDTLGPTCLPGFFSLKAPRDREHLTQKPVDLMRELVKIAPEGGVVLDMFAGSGTTGVAAVQEGRRFIGVEFTEHFAEVAARRLGHAVGQTRQSAEQIDLFGEEAS